MYNSCDSEEVLPQNFDLQSDTEIIAEICIADVPADSLEIVLVVVHVHEISEFQAWIR